MKDSECSNKTYWANYLDNKLERLQGYHNHKENMVNAGFLVQLTLFSTIIMRNIWPPQWMVGMEMVSGLSTLIVYVVFWYLLHNFIGWQLQNKRVTALFINGYEKALANLMFLESHKIDASIEEEAKKDSAGWFIKFIAGIFPIKKVTISYDMSDKGLPKFITEEIKLSFLKKTGGLFHERLLMFGSLLMLVLSALRMLSYIIN